MGQRSQVPKFGNWENEEDVPYTAYFDKARQTRTGGKIINPKDPEENPGLSSSAQPPAKGHSKLKAELEALRGSDSPGHKVSGGGGVSSGESHKRPGKPGSFEKSPLHHQARTPERGVGARSPLWDGKGNENNQGSGGKSRVRTPQRFEDGPEKGAAVPKFGDWDENNPASADGYTHIFNKVREERNYAGRVPGTPNRSSNSNPQKSPPRDGSKCCCFPIGGK